jgi:hypothetical protein
VVSDESRRAKGEVYLMFDRMALQSLVTNLDLNRMTVKEAKAHVSKHYNLELPGRTKEDVIRAMKKIAEQNDPLMETIQVMVEPKISASMHAEDAEIARIYVLKVPASAPEGVQAGLVLDAFHQNVPIKVLEDFDIRVVRSFDGVELAEAADFDSGNHSITARFIGHI